MALSDLKRTNNKWALLVGSYDRCGWVHSGCHALYMKLGTIDYPDKCILVQESYQTMPEDDAGSIYFDSIFDKTAIICRENIIDWLRIFYPDLRKVI